MKKIFAVALTLIVVFACMLGCVSEQNPAKINGEQSTTKTEASTEGLKPPVNNENGALRIDSIDKVNYYAALRIINGVTSQGVRGGNVASVLIGIDMDPTWEESTPPIYPEVPEVETTAPDVTEGPPTTTASPETPTTEGEIYFYEFDPDQMFFINKVNMFTIELTDENGFLASQLGLGEVEVVITEDFLWGDSIITFRNGEKFFSCLSNGMWDFSTHKYIEGFRVVKNFRQENYAFYISLGADGQVTGLECQGSQNGGNRADQNVKIVGSTVISTYGGSFTVAELESYFNSYDEEQDEGYKDITDLYTLTKNDDNTYSYSFSDLEGNILFENNDVVREPKINQIAVNVYELITQAGTGLSTRWAVYCDVENSKISDIYYYVLCSTEKYVICGDFKNDEHFIVVQEIFSTGEDRYYKEYKLENVSPVAADFVVDFKIDTNGDVIVKYLTGNDYTETDITISLP